MFILFTIFGKHHELLDGLPVYKWDQDDADAYSSYHELSNGNKKYYIKFDRKGEMLNPLGSVPSYKEFKGLPATKLLEVGKKKFDTYNLFLKTKNPIYYNQARRIMNAER